MKLEPESKLNVARSSWLPTKTDSTEARGKKSSQTWIQSSRLFGKKRDFRKSAETTIVAFQLFWQSLKKTFFFFFEPAKLVFEARVGDELDDICFSKTTTSTQKNVVGESRTTTSSSRIATLSTLESGFVASPLPKCEQMSTNGAEMSERE